MISLFADAIKQLIPVSTEKEVENCVKRALKDSKDRAGARRSRGVKRPRSFLIIDSD